jgi:O-antigen/teichoic acid export membrane protein
LADEAGGPSLKTRVVRATGWVTAGQIVQRIFTLIRLVVLARLLAPSDFGLFGIVMLTLGVLDTLTRTGFSTALIQRHEKSDSHLDTAWTIGLIRGAVLSAVMYAVAPAVAGLFREPGATGPLRLMAAVVAVNGLGNQAIVYLRKELDFRRYFVFQMVPLTVTLAASLALAFPLPSVWALVWGQVAGAGVGVVMSYVVVPRMPRLHLGRREAVELFRYGRWLWGDAIVAFLARRADDAYLGRVRGAGALGIYQVAYQISNTPATEVLHIANSVMLPAYAKVQLDQRRLRQAFLPVFEVVMSLSLPLAVFIFAAAPQIVLGLLGEKWAAAIVPIQVLAVAGFLRALVGIAAPVFQGTGRPQMGFLVGLARVVGMAVVIYPLTAAFGIPGTAASVAVGFIAALPFWSRVMPLVGVGLRDLLRHAAAGVVLSAMVPAGVCLARLLPVRSPLVLLFCETALTGVLCSACVLVTGVVFRRGLFVHGISAWKAALGASRPAPGAGRDGV